MNMPKTSPENLPLVTLLLSLGFEITSENTIRLHVEDTLYIAIVTDYHKDDLWVQFRDKNFQYITENSQSDHYCKNLNEILAAMAAYSYEVGDMAKSNHIKKVLRLR